MTDGEMDRAIDAAVRQMMTVEPSADVKARVFERLGAREEKVFTWPRVAAVAAAVILLAFVLIRLPRPAPAPEMASAPAVPAPVALSPEAPAVEREPTGPPSQPPAHRSRAVERRVVATRLEVAQTVPALETIDPLVVETPLSRAIEPAEIVIAPMAAIPEVHVEPLFRGLEQH